MNTTTPQNEATTKKNLALGNRYFGDYSISKPAKFPFRGCEDINFFISASTLRFFVDSRGMSNIIEPRKEKSKSMVQLQVQ